jgi:hypothetical protein
MMDKIALYTGYITLIYIGYCILKGFWFVFKVLIIELGMKHGKQHNVISIKDVIEQEKKRTP